MRIKLTLLLLVAHFLAGCAEPATPRPALALLSAQATATVDMARRNEMVTATAQRVVFDATQTRLAQDARADVTRSAAEAFATQAAITSTRMALDATQLALDKLSAQSTATAQMWPTAAMATSQALYTTYDTRREREATAAHGWRLLLGVLTVLAVCFAGWLIVATLEYIADLRERHRHEVEMNRLVEDHENALNAQLWARSGASPEQDDSEDIRRQLWLRRLKLFFQAGDRLGFSNRSLCPDVISNRNWGRLVRHLVGAGVLAIDGDQKVGTVWGAGWSLERLARDDWAELKALPLPAGDPPDVRWGGNAPRSETLKTLETA